jgi:hypothetical protein
MIACALIENKHAHGALRLRRCGGRLTAVAIDSATSWGNGETIMKMMAVKDNLTTTNGRVPNGDETTGTMGTLSPITWILPHVVVAARTGRFSGQRQPKWYVPAVARGNS